MMHYIETDDTSLFENLYYCYVFSNLSKHPHPTYDSYSPYLLSYARHDCCDGVLVEDLPVELQTLFVLQGKNICNVTDDDVHRRAKRALYVKW